MIKFNHIPPKEAGDITLDDSGVELIKSLMQVRKVSTVFGEREEKSVETGSRLVLVGQATRMALLANMDPADRGTITELLLTGEVVQQLRVALSDENCELNTEDRTSARYFGLGMSGLSVDVKEEATL